MYCWKGRHYFEPIMDGKEDKRTNRSICMLHFKPRRKRSQLMTSEVNRDSVKGVHPRNEVKPSLAV